MIAVQRGAPAAVGSLDGLEDRGVLIEIEGWFSALRALATPWIELERV